MICLKALWQGFRFGMLLQLAVGPVCIFIFQTSIERGFWAAGSGALGVALIDAIYIFAAVSGIGALLERKGQLRTALHRIGALVLGFYGFTMIWSSFHFSAVSTISSSTASTGATFLQGAVLTLSSPLTIVFWIGVFAAELSQKEGKHSPFFFGAGAVCASLCFLISIAAVGSAAYFLISPLWLSALHLIAGLSFLYFGLTKLRQKM